MLGRLQVGGLDAEVFVNLEHSSILYRTRYHYSIILSIAYYLVLNFDFILFLFSFPYPLAFSFLVHTVPSQIQISCDFNCQSRFFFHS